MKILDVLSPEVINAELVVDTKTEVLSSLVNLLYENNKIKDKEKVLHILLEREKLGSTGIGAGIAIPHGKYNDIETLVAAFGRSMKGVDFEAEDKKPVFLFFLFLAPESAANLHLRILARISRLLKRESFREKLLEARDARDILEVIRKEEEE
ncbi:MAG: PTS sugar transporter subunit IIA [bacterium]